jgi:hypothetical protein
MRTHPQDWMAAVFRFLERLVDKLPTHKLTARMVANILFDTLAIIALVCYFALVNGEHREQLCALVGVLALSFCCVLTSTRPTRR